MRQNSLWWWSFILGMFSCWIGHRIYSMMSSCDILNHSEIMKYIWIKLFSSLLGPENIFNSLTNYVTLLGNNSCKDFSVCIFWRWVIPFVNANWSQFYELSSPLLAEIHFIQKNHLPKAYLRGAIKRNLWLIAIFVSFNTVLLNSS